MHNNLLYRSIFFNPWILRNPQLKDFKDYGATVKDVLKPESYGLSNDDCRHCKLIDQLDKQGFKLLSALKDDPGFMNLNWFTYFRLKFQLENFKKQNQGLILTSTGATLPSDKMVKTPFQYNSCVCESFKRVKKGYSYYRRILPIQKPGGKITYKTKMEKMFGVNLKQDYVNSVITMLISGMIPTENSDILHRLILGITRSGEELRK